MKSKHVCLVLPHVLNKMDKRWTRCLAARTAAKSPLLLTLARHTLDASGKLASQREPQREDFENMSELPVFSLLSNHLEPFDSPGGRLVAMRWKWVWSASPGRVLSKWAGAGLSRCFVTACFSIYTVRCLQCLLGTLPLRKKCAKTWRTVKQRLSQPTSPPAI